MLNLFEQSYVRLILYGVVAPLETILNKKVKATLETIQKAHDLEKIEVFFKKEEKMWKEVKHFNEKIKLRRITEG